MASEHYFDRSDDGTHTADYKKHTPDILEAFEAKKAGATDAELAEAAWVATAIRAGGGFAHGRLAFKFAGEHTH